MHACMCLYSYQFALCACLDRWDIYGFKLGTRYEIQILHENLNAKSAELLNLQAYINAAFESKMICLYTTHGTSYIDCMVAYTFL